MVYDGLEYGSERGFSFTQVREFFKDTLALFGPSKAGLAALRAGIVVGDKRFIDDLKHRAMMNQYFPARPALHAMEAYFNTAEPFAGKRREHLERMNADHRFHGLLMKALINGIGTMTEIAPKDRQKLVQAVMDHDGNGAVAAITRLNRPVAGVKVITTPQAGFFHLLDFSGLRKRVYPNDLVPNKCYSGWSKVRDAHDVSGALGIAENIRTASGEWSRLEKSDMVVRVSFAMPIEDIFDFTERLQRGMKNFVRPSRASGYKAEATLAP
jgi:aspartate/methionine/tyrosine aminotransferase